MTTSAQSAQRVIITGGHGFVGQHLRAAITSRHPDWDIFAPLSPLVSKDSASVDVTDWHDVVNMVRVYQPSQIVHLAALSAIQASEHDPRGAWRTNLEGTLNIVEAIRMHAPACRLLFVSSAEVYGRSFDDGLPLDETALLQPTNPYAASKAAADILVQQAGWSGLQTCVVRPFNHTGAGQMTAFVVPSFAAQIAAIERGQAEPVIQVGELNDERDFLDVADVVRAYILLLETPNWPIAAVYNISSGIRVRIGDVLRALLAESDVRERVKIEVDSSRVRRNGVSKVSGVAVRIRNLGWRPERDFATTVREVMIAARSTPSAVP